MNKREREDQLRQLPKEDRDARAAVTRDRELAARERDSDLAEAARVTGNTVRNAQEDFTRAHRKLLEEQESALRKAREGFDARAELLRARRLDRYRQAEEAQKVRQDHVLAAYQGRVKEIEEKSGPALAVLAERRKQVEAEFTASEQKRKGIVDRRPRPPDPKVAATMAAFGALAGLLEKAPDGGRPEKPG